MAHFIKLTCGIKNPQKLTPETEISDQLPLVNMLHEVRNIKKLQADYRKNRSSKTELRSQSGSKSIISKQKTAIIILEDINL